MPESKGNWIVAEINLSDPGSEDNWFKIYLAGTFDTRKKAIDFLYSQRYYARNEWATVLTTDMFNLIPIRETKTDERTPANK